MIEISLLDSVSHDWLHPQKQRLLERANCLLRGDSPTIVVDVGSSRDHQRAKEQAKAEKYVSHQEA